jgi:hypothetical protein
LDPGPGKYLWHRHMIVVDSTQVVSWLFLAVKSIHQLKSMFRTYIACFLLLVNKSNRTED